MLFLPTHQICSTRQVGAGVQTILRCARVAIGPPPEATTSEYGERLPVRILFSPADGACVLVDDSLRVMACKGARGWGPPPTPTVRYKVQDVEQRGGVGRPVTRVLAIKVTQ
jgi:hypothetical protein